jgi:methylmalonyl-CoA/ethylmalonyl-CoA epimerase
MAKINPAKIKITPLHQVGLIVKDVDETVKNYWNIFGIGPHVIHTIDPIPGYIMTYRGKPAKYKFKASFCQVGPVELEFLQSLAGPTIYSDYLVQHGEGANHLQYLLGSVEEIDKHVKIMARNGFPVLMGGHFESIVGYAYFDTVSTLKTIWETVKLPEGPFGNPPATYPASNSEISPAKIKVEAITNIGIVVENMEDVMANYQNIMGISPWDIVEHASPLLHNVIYHGKAIDSSWKTATTNTGHVKLELLQPISGNNIFSDFISKHGANSFNFIKHFHVSIRNCFTACM